MRVVLELVVDQDRELTGERRVLAIAHAVQEVARMIEKEETIYSNETFTFPVSVSYCETAKMHTYDD